MEGNNIRVRGNSRTARSGWSDNCLRDDGFIHTRMMLSNAEVRRT